MAHSNIREQRALDETLMTFDLRELSAKLKSEDIWKKSGKNSITLNMGEALRMVLVVLREGGLLKSHTTDHPISVQVLEGELEFGTEAGIENLKEGGLLILQHGISHSVKARKETAFLLTFGAEESR